MTETVIRVENASVAYQVPKESTRTFKEYAIRLLEEGTFRDQAVIQALDDFSLQVQKGEFLGVIGANGAGKSTLLKLIAQVMRPTSGRVYVKGRVAPLLAMGAGFHPDLTGRENVYLNGTLLGYKRGDLEERFERIVDFAGLREFIDAPIRTYSSGMTMRLAFAVATDVQPDILLVDEVLSVGDAYFQEKSMKRIHAYQRRGTTTVMVSHDLGTVKRSCDQVIWLDDGRVQYEGDPEKAVEKYRTYMKKNGSGQIK
jgi:ABC-2 type transport system ATP-binding protein/lipopolysaccharide transport system ATP-binding protein